ncbi:MAG: hypothetical protein Q7T82_10955 [Armatimonadota bacterium]|nr:hypothetical protein [Armatimonadota bacterium]
MDVQEELRQVFIQDYKVLKSKRYNPIYFIRMLDEYGAVGTVKKLLAAKEPQTGLYRLKRLDCLKLSMEARVCDERFSSLFTTEEVRKARARLEEMENSV